MYIVDTHCDTLHGMLIKNEVFGKNTLQINYEKLSNSSSEGFLQFFAVFESPSSPMSKQKNDVKAMIESFHQITAEYKMLKVLKKDDLEKKGIKSLLSLEGLYFMEGNVDMLDDLYQEGVRCMSLTWNPDNEFSGGVAGKSNLGLSKKGYELVEKAMKMGILLDVSHITDNGFWDIKKLADKYDKPFVATHSNARKICSHKRNLNDKMINALSQSGGVAGINMFSCFLNDNCEAGLVDVIKHIEYICALTGPEHVGFGCDFDGIDKERSALPGPKALSDVLERLLQLNYSERDVMNIASGNFLRVLGEVLE